MRRLLLVIAIAAAAACSNGLKVVGPGDEPDPGPGWGGFGGQEWTSGCGGPFDSCDRDGDGHCAPSCGGDDCNDRNPAVFPGAPELCDGFIDENCDGAVDEGCSCAPGDVRLCYPRGGDDPSRNVGACHDGQQRCNDSGEGWGPCLDFVLPANEAGCDGIDQNCNGVADDGFTNSCGTCGEAPREVCGNGLDDDCDGRIDPTETCDLACDDLDADVDLPRLACCLLPPGSDVTGTPCERRDCDGRTNQPCYSGPPPTLGKGICHGGQASCVGARGDRHWTLCEGEQLPLPEICGDGLDDDCDGQIDEENGETHERCHRGGDPPPNVVELCDDGVDNDWDGFIDEGCLATADEQACYDGRPGTRGVGACQDGLQRRDGAWWGPCAGAVTDTAETCGDGIDSDCDGFGGPGTDDDAGCCVPAAEVCNGVDDDCDGLVDELLLNACGTCDAPCYDHELIRGATLPPFTRVLDAHHLDARWYTLSITAPTEVRAWVSVGPMQDDLGAPCASGTGLSLDLQGCNVGMSRFASVTIASGGPPSSVRLSWSRP